MTDAEKDRARQNMELAWADGKFDNRRQGMHPRHWTPAQNQAFTALAGTMPIAEIADELERRFYIRRSIPSLRIQAKRLGISLWQGGLSMRDMERVFSVDHKHIKRFWVDAGYLSARRWNGRGPFDGWWFDESEVVRFVHECGWLFDVERMKQGHRLTRIAETARKVDPWIIGIDALTMVLRLAPVNVKRWLRRGLIPHQKRATSGRGDTVCVRGRDVPSIREAIREAQVAARNAAQERMRAWRQAESQRLLLNTLQQQHRLTGSCKRGHARSLETARVSPRGRLVCLACRQNRIAMGRAG